MGFVEFYLPRFLLAIPPVFALLFGLRLLDTYKLVSLPQVMRSIAWGCAAAGVCYALNSAVFTLAPANADWHARLGAPALEEVCKAAYVIWLVRTARVGFLVDAAICGFAAGAGFSLIENLYDMRVFVASSLAVWTLRGFGTAIMHGGTTAIVAIIGSRVGGGAGTHQVLRFLAGLLLGGIIHAAWNMALMTPLGASVAVMVGLPLLFTLVFIRSERALHRWMGAKLDQDLELLAMLRTGEFPATRLGDYVRRLQHSFTPPVVADMHRLLELSSELSGIAKGNLIRASAGLAAESDPSLSSHLRELNALERRLGPAACHALAPLRAGSSRDLWELKQLSANNRYST